jgi:Flp pilus assembly protein TadG
MRTSVPTRRRKDTGQTVVEFTLVLPILLMVITGLISAGGTYANYTQLGDVARSGARTAVVSRTAADRVGRTVSAAQGAAASLNLSQLGVTVSSPWTPGSTVTVTATYPWELQIFGLGLTSGTLTQTTTMRVE